MKLLEKPSVGLVVGTYGTPAYIHLHLVVCRAHHPNLKVLIKDDGSNSGDELKKICDTYNADFITSKQRLPRFIGDIANIVKGLEWAKYNDIDILLKLSRRFIIHKAWVNSLQELAMGTEYATFSAPDAHLGWGFRSECFGMCVNAWHKYVYNILLQDVEECRIPNPESYCAVESYLHQCARYIHKQIHNQQNDILVMYEKHYARPENYGGYAIWPLMGLSRWHNLPYILWHDRTSVEEYYYLSQLYNLPYDLDDFRLKPSEDHQWTNEFKPQAKTEQIF